MNPIFLDTNAALWSAQGTIAKSAARLIEAATERGELLLSPITAWEVALLAKKGRIHLALPAHDFIRALFDRAGVLTAQLTPTIAAAAAALPAAFPADPADRMIFASAQAYCADLVTRDRAILEFAKRTKGLRCIVC